MRVRVQDRGERVRRALGFFLHGDFGHFPGAAWHGRFIPPLIQRIFFFFNHLVILERGEREGRHFGHLAWGESGACGLGVFFFYLRFVFTSKMAMKGWGWLLAVRYQNGYEIGCIKSRRDETQAS